MWSNARPIPSIVPSISRLCALFSGSRNHLSKGHWIQAPGSKSNELNCMCTLAMSNDAGKVDQEMFFSQPAFNRAVDRRTDSKWLSDVFSTSALVIPMLGSKSLLKAGVPVMVPSTTFQTSKLMEEGFVCKPIFLGLTDAVNKPLFATEVSSFCSAGADVPVWMEGADWVDLRKYGPQLQINDAGLLAYARGMVEWHTRNRFCGCCGDKMEVKEGGHRLQCSSATCGSSFYPRLDPAVIMLVTCGDYVLLGRQNRWDPGRYSLLAGFVEVGETFETAVAREVQEEAGIKLNSGSIRYAACQPWPFPSSLMVGFTAEARKNPTLKVFEPHLMDGVVPVGNESLHDVIDRHSLPKPEVDTKELEDARWIHKCFLNAVLQGLKLPYNSPFSVPGKNAIAHFLMQQWTSQCGGTEWAGNQLPIAEIDEGIFKYVLIRVYDGCGNQKLVIRGNKKMENHSDILKDARENLQHLGLEIKVLGGGRMEHHLVERTIHVYGFSQAYGQANHDVTVMILQQWFPLHSISLSWDGY